MCAAGNPGRRTIRTIRISEDEIYAFLDTPGNPPDKQNQGAVLSFQREMREVYDLLICSLSPFGEEGSSCGVSDHPVAPDLRHRPTGNAPPAPPQREFTIAILTGQSRRSQFLSGLARVVAVGASKYRIGIRKDFDAGRHRRVFLTIDQAQFCCEYPRETARLSRIL